MIWILLLFGALLAFSSGLRAEGEGANDEGTSGDDPPAGAKKTESMPEPMIPKSRFDEILRKLRDLEKQTQEQSTAQQKAEEERLAKQAEWEKLAHKRGEELGAAQRAQQAAEAALAEAQRRQSFSEAALAAAVPPDRIPDAYLLAAWPDEGEPDFAQVVKTLIAGKPWLLQGATSAPPNSAESGRGTNRRGEERAGIVERLVPPGLFIPKRNSS